MGTGISFCSSAIDNRSRSPRLETATGRDLLRVMISKSLNFTFSVTVRPRDPLSSQWRQTLSIRYGILLRNLQDMHVSLTKLFWKNYLKYKTFGFTPRFAGAHLRFANLPLPSSYWRGLGEINSRCSAIWIELKVSHYMSFSSRIALFIDGANLHARAKTLGFDVDYKRLLKEFQSRGTLVRALYYSVILEDQEFSSIRPLIDWLDYNGYTVITKPAKEFDDGEGRRKVRRNMHIEVAVDAMELAESVDQIVLFSGDGDFRSLVEAIQRRGVRVTVVSTMSSRPPMVADELRRQADVFTDLMDLKSKIERDPSERPGPRESR